MLISASANQSEPFATFGSYLRFLRRRARLTQRELAVAVNYSEGQICHLERGRRAPELATLAALFVPALYLDQAPDESARLLALAAAHHTPTVELDLGDPRPVAVATNAPGPALPLIGRAQQRAAIRVLLETPTVRLVTLIGPPGVGKTHLALQIAQDLQGSFPDGVHFIDLTSISDAALLAPLIAQALDLGEDVHTEPLAILQHGLRGQRALLVLDNFEQVVAAAPLLAKLLSAAPGIVLLVTSQVALRLQAEHVFSVPPLPVPDLGHLPEIDALAKIESVALLIARLRAVNPDLELTPINALPLAAICVRVDGLPLAIELVASRGNLLEPQELLTEVAQRFQQLRRRGRDVPPRHQTLTAALSWSHKQLSLGAQALFARLSVFVGKWSIDVVEAVCDLDQVGRAVTHDWLEELIEHSLVQRHAHHGETYLGMLVMVRLYAQEQLHLRNEADLLQNRLLTTYIERAEYAEQKLSFSAEQKLWMARLEAEHDTIRVLLGWSLESGNYTQGLRLVGALWRFWYMRGMLREGRRWLETFLALPLQGSAATRAHALDGAGILAWRQGEYAQADVWLGMALDIYRSEQHQRGEARVLSHLGMLKAERGEYEQALIAYEASLAIYHMLDDSIGAAGVLHNLGNLHCHQNNHPRAMEIYTECLTIYQQHASYADIALISLGIGAVARDQGQGEVASVAFIRSLEIARTLGDEWTVATALLNLGDIACDHGETAEAQRHFNAALAIFERLGDQQQMTVIQSRLALVAFLSGDRASAVDLYRQSLMLANALGFQPGLAEGLEGLASCATQDQPLLAARLYATAAALRETLGLPISLADQPRHQQALCATQRGVDPLAWAAAWRDGQQLAPSRAIALALTSVPHPYPSPGGRGG
jgi:predicted ATPase/transcriptional regulator with XRE-family HTH domain